ncbi:hypothetical protein Nepgr_013157 [Nepenthes gracilis]|uniref:Uncharacterized protein n=1 Tax=Nepenthes gracilis TaxID=150966 RepID=A0AAD3SIF8_NEPGR|nr:hypothetical protein Nepgr_013157 [Nepenthes gracilis]
MSRHAPKSCAETTDKSHLSVSLVFGSCCSLFYQSHSSSNLVTISQLLQTVPTGSPQPWSVHDSIFRLIGISGTQALSFCRSSMDCNCSCLVLQGKVT